ncbi:glycosyltransferase [Photobacterium carnosum]|uniref:glycosyltransferase n=1 Tax=Photobacterium carnosum TaxID=2023717 RepID=UPI001E62C742|nr:glycosyltransferase [Photobacterium carnosum]MCD9557569.1 glycosyltransferase [Photobacterium carnosum]
MKKISLVLPNLAGGGAERVNIDLAIEFSKYFAVDIVVCNAIGAFSEEAKKNFNVVDLQANSKIKIIKSLAKYIDDERPDCLIASMWGLTALVPFAKALAKHKPKLLLVEHSSLVNQFRYSQLKVRLWLKVSTFVVYRMADAVAGVSSGVAQDMQKLAYLKSTPEVLYNPIPMSKSQNLKSNDTVKKIVTAGRLIEAKDHVTLIKAFAQLDKAMHKLTILGDGPLLVALQQLAKDLDVYDNITFTGFVENPTDYYKTADLFVLSSDREGFGNVIVEALSCGTPVVSTDCEHGPSEILNGGEFGRLVPVGDDKALASAIEEALLQKYDKEKLIQRARDFSPEKSAKRYLEVLGLMIDQK